MESRSPGFGDGGGEKLSLVQSSWTSLFGNKTGRVAGRTLSDFSGVIHRYSLLMKPRHFVEYTPLRKRIIGTAESVHIEFDNLFIKSVAKAVSEGKHRSTLDLLQQDEKFP